MVLLIVAIAAATVTLRVQGPLRRARFAELRGRLAVFDALTRRHAREHDRPVLLLVDLIENRIWRTDEEGSEQLGAVLRLPADVTIRRLWIGQKRITAGSASIACSRGGLTPTYAMCLEDGDGRKLRFFVAGLTGQVLRLDSDEQIEEILAALQPRGNAH